MSESTELTHAELVALVVSQNRQLRKLHADVAQLKKDGTWMRNRMRQAGVIQSASSDEGDKEFFCPVCTNKKGERVTHTSAKVVNNHTAQKRAAKKAAQNKGENNAAPAKVTDEEAIQAAKAALAAMS